MPAMTMTERCRRVLPMSQTINSSVQVISSPLQQPESFPQLALYPPLIRGGYQCSDCEAGAVLVNAKQEKRVSGAQTLIQSWRPPNRCTSYGYQASELAQRKSCFALSCHCIRPVRFTCGQISTGSDLTCCGHQPISQIIMPSSASGGHRSNRSWSISGVKWIEYLGFLFAGRMGSRSRASPL